MFKRLFDILLATFSGLILLGPGILVFIAVKLTSKGPAIYWSKRIGKNNEIFLMPKFRTMKVDTPQLATHKLQNPESYLTSIGPLLRKTSLDELPQLYSIFCGHMSFVGPRPALFNQDELIKLRTDNGVHSLIPGLTGWAQINGRDDLCNQLKVKFDSEYLERRSFVFDIKIIFLTFYRVMLNKNVSH